MGGTILAAAILSGATHLVTGDVRHFGAWYGRRVAGVPVLRPGAYLQPRPEAEPAEAASAVQPVKAAARAQPA